MDRRIPWFFYAVGVVALFLSALGGRLSLDYGALIAIVAFVGAMIAAIQSIGRAEDEKRDRSDATARESSSPRR